MLMRSGFESLESSATRTKALDAASRCVSLGGLDRFSGTIPSLTQEITRGSSFRVQLLDARLGRTLAREYAVKTLDFLKDLVSHG
jgi:hypothetical protein